MLLLYVVYFVSLVSRSWLYEVCRGVEHEPVRPRQLALSIGCGKNYYGKEQLDTREKVLMPAFHEHTEVE